MEPTEYKEENCSEVESTEIVLQYSLFYLQLQKNHLLQKACSHQEG